MNKSGTETAGGGLSTSAHTEEVTATSLGISIADNVRRYVRSLPDGAEVTRDSCFQWFVEQWPKAKTLTAAFSFKNSISTTLSQLCGKKIIHVMTGGGTGRKLVYRKGAPVAMAVREPEQTKVLASAAERSQIATRAAAVELAYVETWGEHSPKSTEVLRMVVEAAKS